MYWAVFFWTLTVWGQRFPMKFVGELGHLSVGQRMGPARAQAEGVVQITGTAWKVTIGVTGGIGWTELFTADFDADGRMDYLIAEHLSGCGHCIGFTTVTVLLFDGRGRPAPWQFGAYLPRGPGFENATFPFLPVRVTDTDRDGRAEFVVTDCKQYQEEIVSGVYEAREGRLRPRGVAELLPGYGGALDGRIEEILGDGIGMDGEAEIRIAGQRGKGWPKQVITDTPNGREIDMYGGWDKMLSAMRNGFPVKRLGDSGWLLVDGTASADRANVVVDLEVAGVSRARITPVAPKGGWTRSNGGTLEELLPDGVTIRTSHMAMQHTVTGETRYARPPGARRLTGMVELGDFELTEWGPGFFALHSGRGELISSRVRLAVEGELAVTQEGIMLLRGSESITVRGRLRWRRE